ncbi:MAG: cytochrome c-type biogenesis CcmF C-terminal domain-containing protein, partial [Nitriliruptorales bacterium]
MPWLTGTALLHSAVAQRHRGLLRSWNVSLTVTTFALTILGTFLTRSGVVNSVHSFTQSAVGPILLGFFVTVLAGGFGLFATRGHLVASPRRLDALVSREGALLVNNLLLSVFMFTVLLGTTYPIFVEAISGAQLSVGRPFRPHDPAAGGRPARGDGGRAGRALPRRPRRGAVEPPAAAAAGRPRRRGGARRG